MVSSTIFFNTPVKLAPDPLKLVAVSNPVEELNFKLEPDLAPRFPLALVANKTLHPVSDDSSATVIVVAIAAVPVVSWFRVGTLAEAIVPEDIFAAFKVVKDAPDPLNSVAVNNPEDELKVKFVPDLGAKFPVAAVENNGKQVVSEDSSATVIVVAMAAVPVVFWLRVGILAVAIVPEAIFPAAIPVMFAPPPIN